MKQLCIFLLLVVSFSSLAQERATLERLKRDKEICKAFAEKSIQELDDGVLLVRLNFRQKEIDYLNNRQDTSAANQVQRMAMQKNQQIADAFRQHFDFCTVYFFQMADSRFVTNQQFDSITLYDLSFNEIDSSKLTSDNYLIGEFGYVKQDTSYYYSETRKDTSKEREKENVYYGGSKNGREAFIIMDRKFQQIQKPFPYFSGMSSILSEAVRFKKAIEEINTKLGAYSKQVGIKEETTGGSN